jgi:hypothetical protein
MRVTYRPIEQYPSELTPSYRRKRSPFDAPWSATLELLERELTHLSAKEVIFQLDLTDAEIRLDGMPRANATPKSPAIVIAFESKHGPLQYATDVFTHWQANVRAVALGLESLRRVERYGITKSGQQYRGWQQLGAGTPMPAAQMTVDDAARFFAEHVGKGATPGEFWNAAEGVDAAFVSAHYRQLAKTMHPDAGGSTELFQKLQQAKAVLDKHAS